MHSKSKNGKTATAIVIGQKSLETFCFVDALVNRHLHWVEDRLSSVSYFAGAEFTAADIMMHFPGQTHLNSSENIRRIFNFSQPYAQTSFFAINHKLLQTLSTQFLLNNP